MRSPVRDRQKIWFATITEHKEGLDGWKEYGKPVMKKMTVSTGTGQPGQISAGLVVDYDREVVNYDHSFTQTEGNAVWVDVVPKLNEDGSLVMSDDGVTPVTPPDYWIKQIFRTQKGNVDVFGIKRYGGNR